MEHARPTKMSYKQLKDITDGFADERLLGSGSFGVVYKGIREDEHKIAVKLLHGMQGVDDKEFHREFNNLTKLKHENIVQLLGFCNEAEEVPMEHDGKHIIAFKMHRALCFEYMNNGSLQRHLYSEQQGFDWQKRYKIIKGVCEGLKHLHTGLLEGPVYHLDLKPDNILLDTNMVPKIADFGLSRLLGEDNTKKTINPVGTCGYCPPEFVNYQIISTKFDIFSLGVIIIKIICGAEGYSLVDSMSPAKFVKRVLQQWKERLKAEQGYTSLQTDCRQVKKCLEIALKCIEQDKERRPNIVYIIDQLNGTEKGNKDTAPRIEEVGSLKSSSRDVATDGGGGKGQESKRIQRGTLPREVTAAFLKKITDNFSEERIIGEFISGKIYKGILPEGGEIAVKMYVEDSPALLNTFELEVTSLMGIQHENIIVLTGYCYNKQRDLVEKNGKYLVVDRIENFICYEYLPMGSLDRYIYAETSNFDWDIRLKVTKGICEGLYFLHSQLDGPLIHMNLVPNSIWLDNNWVPKITNFEFSRLFVKEQSRKHTINVMGHIGYLAPEYLYRGEISTMSDIYSLGIIILEIVTGDKNVTTHADKASRKFVENVYENWNRDDRRITARYPLLDANGLQQVKACIQIGLRCVEADRNKRPSILDIVKRISVVDGTDRHSIGKNNYNVYKVNTSPFLEKKVNTSHQIMRISTELLDVYPGKVGLPVKPDKLIASCSLQLRNKTDDCVGIRLLTKNRKMYMARMPLCCIVPARSTYVLVITAAEQKKQPPNNIEEILTLESRIILECQLNKSLKNSNPDSSMNRVYEHMLEKLKEADANNVHELRLKVISDPPEEENSCQSQIEIKCGKKFSQVLSVDVHPAEPWIMTSHHTGEIFIWDYEEQEVQSSFDFAQKPVYSAKFIEREEWIVAADGDGTINVYSYITDEEVASIQAHDSDITCLAVHPDRSLVLSSSDDYLIKLWDWGQGWKCAQTFEGHTDRVTQVNFCPLDSNNFASVSFDHTIKIWSISSSECIMTWSDRPDPLLCVLNYTSDTQHQYLITGSSDGTAQVWDVETRTCFQTLKGHAKCISSVYHIPEISAIITGSHDGTVRLWNSTTYRLENIIGVNLGEVCAVGYVKSLRRIVIGCQQGFAIMEIDFP